MNKYQAAFRNKKSKAEITQDTLAFNAQDAMTQCIVDFGGRGFLFSEYELVKLGPHPDEIQISPFSLMPTPQRVK